MSGMGGASDRRYDLVAIGGGTGGLVTAAGAAYLGLDAAIVERSALGGDCLWTGCVPSKAVIASARLAHRMERPQRLGLGQRGGAPDSAGNRSATAPRGDFRSVMERMRAARAAVAHHDDPQRFRDMGVAVHFGSARFLDAAAIEVDGVGVIRSKRFVIATGAVAAKPPIPGLNEIGHWTYENVFDQSELPESMAILGGGPIGCEFAQVFSRLGARVTVLEAAPRILVDEDDDVSTYVADLLRAEGIEVRTGAAVIEVRAGRPGPAGKVVRTEDGGEVAAAEVFVATGRRPFTDGMDLDAAGVRTERGAVAVDAHLRTSARTVWAVGDVTGAMQFTHVADHMAKTALRNAVLPSEEPDRLRRRAPRHLHGPRGCARRSLPDRGRGQGRHDVPLRA